MAQQLNAALNTYLIKTLLKEGFEPKLIAIEASCSVHAVQRIGLKAQAVRNAHHPNNKPHRPS